MDSGTYQPTFGRDGGNEGENSLAGSAISAPFLGGSGSDNGSIRDSSGTEFDGSIHVGPDKFNGDGTFRKRRGRKAGSGNSGSKKANLSASLDALSTTLMLVHVGLASATKTPELELEEKEADTLAQATARVLEEFDFTPSPKVQAVVGLIVACGSIYGPKAIQIKMRWDAEKEVKEDG